jgi:pimeloyl-ACP methyl ester carboxylesterase
VVEGKPDAFPVIFLHGLPGGAFIWADVIKALGRSRRAIAPDLPGWGKSFTRFAKTEPDLSVAGLQRWLAGLLTAHNIERFDLVAHGDGSWPALEFLISDPSRVRRLCLISAPLWSDNTRVGMIERLLGTAKWSPKRIERWLSDHAALTPRARSEHSAEFESLLGENENSRTSPLLSEMGFPARIPEYIAALVSYKGAELLIWGDHDPAALEERTSALAALLRDPEIHRIPNAGHFPTLDAPEETAALLKELLAE